MQHLKVLQVFTILNRGGAETNLLNYYREIDRGKFQFDFLVHRQEEGAYEAEITQLGGHIYRLPQVHPKKLRTYKKAVQQFFQEHSDYQIIHGQCSELGVFIYEEAKKRKIPVIIAHAHNSKMDWDQKALFRILWKHTMRKYINAYFTCGYEAAVWLFGKKLAANSYQMNNAVNTDQFKFNSEIRTAKRLELNADKTHNFIHIGRFNVQKNHRFLIKIFSEIVKLNPESHLFLVGEGELKKEVIAQVETLDIASKVTFMGLRSDVAEILQAMDVFLFPSLFEGLPVALVEAQTSGICCVISTSIPKEAVLIPQNVATISLRETPQFWAEKILSSSATFTRKEVASQILEAGYDIRENALQLETQYRNLFQKFS